MDFVSLQAPHGPAWELFVAATVIVLCPLFAERLRVPGIVGLLVGGLVIGPNVLGWSGSPNTLVAELGQVGLLYLMFVAGLELDLNTFARYRRAAIVFGLLTFACPMVLGLAAALMLDYSVAAALLIGSLWASHTLVTYPTVKRLGLASNPAVATTVGATVITDVMSLMVLAVVAKTQSGEASGVEAGLQLATGFALLVGFCAVVLPRVARFTFTTLGHDRTVRFMIMLASLLAAAVVAESVHIEGIVGAFFAGLSLNRLVPNASVLMERIEFFGSALFIPIFLVSVGTLIDPDVVGDPATLGLAGLFALACLGGKALAATIAAGTLRFSRNEGGLMFSLSASQAAATLAAATVGFRIGLLGEQVVNAVLVVILLSLLASSATANLFGRRIPQTPVSTDRLGRTVVLPLTQATSVPHLVDLAGRLAHGDGGVLIPVRVVARSSELDLTPHRNFIVDAEEHIARAGVDAEVLLRVDHSLEAGVLHTTVAEDASLLMMEWEASGRAQQLVFGDKSDGVLSDCPVPTVFTRMSLEPINRIVLTVAPSDLAPAKRPTMDLAASLASRWAASGLSVIVVLPDGVDGPALVGDIAGATSASAVNRVNWAHEHAQAGDLFVLALTPSTVLRSEADRLASLPGVSVAVVAVARTGGSPANMWTPRSTGAGA